MRTPIYKIKVIHLLYYWQVKGLSYHLQASILNLLCLTLKDRTYQSSLHLVQDPLLINSIKVKLLRSHPSKRLSLANLYLDTHNKK